MRSRLRSRPMKGKWKRFGAFILAACCVIAAVSIGTRGENQGAWQVLARVSLVGVIAFLTTFVVWPRHLMANRGVRPNLEAMPETPVAPAVVDVPVEPDTPIKPIAEERPGPRPQTETQPQPQPRPAGSRPASEVHAAEAPPARNPRGRRIESRQSSERDFRWPARP